MIKFDKVLMFASGIGITAHLMQIRHLLDLHHDEVTQLRRISLAWIVEAEGMSNA